MERTRLLTIGGLAMMSALSAHGADNPPPIPAHPRLCFTPEELAVLRELRGEGVHARVWGNLAESADWCLTRSPRTEWIRPVSPDPIYLNLYDRFYAIMHDMAVMEHLSFAYAYSGEERYGRGAKDWTLACCRIWRQEADGTVDGAKAYAVSRLLKGLAVAYDCLHPLCTEEERAEIRDTIARIGQAYYDGYFTTPRIAGPGFQTHHAIVEWASFGVAALAILGEYDRADQWLDATVRKFEEHLLPNGLAADGAQVEGATFWASTMHYRLFFMDALRRVTGQDLFKPFAAQMNADLALAAICVRKAPGHDEDHQTVILEPSYGQLNYYAPVLLALARQYRRPIYQHLALWDETVGSIQRTRYVTPNGEQLLFQLGGYAYAWYDPTVPDEVGEAPPLSFIFPNVNEAYARESYEAGGIVMGMRRGKLAIHAGGRPVLIDLYDGHHQPEPVKGLELTDDGALAVMRCTGAPDAGYAEQVVELRRPGHLTVHRTKAAEQRWWCHGEALREGNALTWPDGTSVTVTRGRIVSAAPGGYYDEKVVGLGKLKCVDPLPKQYPLIVAEPDAAGELVIEVVTSSRQSLGDGL